MELAAANWRYDDLHRARPYHNGDRTRWAAEQSKDFPCHYRDGVTIFVTETDLNLGGAFLTHKTESEEDR